MARSVFYYHLTRLNKADGYNSVRQRIGSIYNENKGRYGYRRICYVLRGEGIEVNHKTVLKLMHQLGISATRKKRHYRSYKGEVGKIAPNVIARNFKASAPNQKWTTDVTQVCIQGVKTYLSPVMDMFNGEIIAYTISRSPNLQMTIDMLRAAFRKQPLINGLIMHSDQGWHYQHGRYQKMLKGKGIVQSMSRKGNCLDNSMMENFFGLMKNELLYVNHYDSVEEFEKELKQYAQNLVFWTNYSGIEPQIEANGGTRQSRGMGNLSRDIYNAPTPRSFTATLSLNF